MIRYVVTGQTVWQDVRVYQAVTKDTCPDIHGKFMLVKIRGSAGGLPSDQSVDCAC